MVQTVNYIIIRIPHIRLEGSILYQVWYNEKPDVAYIRTFRSIIYIRIISYRAKLDDRLEPYILIGFNKGTNKHFKVINLKAKRKDLIVKNVYDVYIEERRVISLDLSDKLEPI